MAIQIRVLFDYNIHYYINVGTSDAPTITLVEIWNFEATSVYLVHGDMSQALESVELRATLSNGNYVYGNPSSYEFEDFRAGGGSGVPMQLGWYRFLGEEWNDCDYVLSPTWSNWYYLHPGTSIVYGIETNQ